MRWTSVLFITTILIATATPAEARDPTPAELAAAARAAGTVNGLCPVMGRPVTVKGGTVDYRGERVGFCCPPCAATFQADPVTFMNKMRQGPRMYAYTSKGPTLRQKTNAAASAKSANGICPVMGNLVNPNGGAAAYRGQRIAFCCPGCSGKFRADPERYMKAMRADPMAYGYDRPGPTHQQLRVAREAVGSVNGLCPVMGNLVATNGGTVTYRGETIAFCCPGCAGKFKADPEGHMAKVRAEPAVYGYVKAPKTAANGHGRR